MSAAAATAVDLPRFMRRRELLIGAAVTAIIAALFVGFGPAPGDAAVHLYRTSSASTTTRTGTSPMRAASPRGPVK